MSWGTTRGRERCNRWGRIDEEEEEKGKKGQVYSASPPKKKNGKGPWDHSEP